VVRVLGVSVVGCLCRVLRWRLGDHGDHVPDVGRFACPLGVDGIVGYRGGVPVSWLALGGRWGGELEQLGAAGCVELRLTLGVHPQVDVAVVDQGVVAAAEQPAHRRTPPDDPAAAPHVGSGAGAVAVCWR